MNTDTVSLNETVNLTHLPPRRTPDRLLSIATIGILMVLLFSLGLRLNYMNRNTFDYDEGHWLMFGALAAKGYTPYTEAFVGIPPLALLTIQGSISLLGDALTVRIPMMLYSLIGVAALYRLVKRRSSPTAALLAASLLSFNSIYFTSSTTVMAEVPAVSMALLAIVLSDIYITGRRRFWLFLSGAMFAVSLLLKVFVVFLPIIVLAQLAQQVWSRPDLDTTPDRLKQMLILFGLWLSGSLAVIAPFLLIYDPFEMYEQVIYFRILLREAKLVQGIGYDENWAILQDNLEQSLPLLALGLLGLLVEGRKNPRRIRFWLLWFGLAIPVLLLQVPLRPRYFVLALPPLTALSGIVLARWIDGLESRLKWGHSHRRRLATLAAVSGLGFFQLMSVLAISPETHIFDPEPDGSLSAETASRLSVATFLHRMTTPNDCIIVDDQRLAFITDRMVPPFLTETTNARFDVGWLTTRQILNVAHKEQCAALVFINDRFEQRVPDLQLKAADQFSLKMVFAAPDSTEEILVFFVPINTNRRPALRLNQLLGQQIMLVGADLTSSQWRAGQEISISTYWRARQKPARDYKIFLHLRDAAGNTVINFDHYPFGAAPSDLIAAVWPTGTYLQGHSKDQFTNYPATGLLPTRLWIPGQTLKETITTTLPETVPPGVYSLRIGLYDEQTGERLSAADPNHSELSVGGPIEVLK